MVRAGLFSDVDAVVSWHPGDRNEASPTSSTANITGKFRFRGVAAHAAAAPTGAVGARRVEAMDYMVNMMREHVPQETRIHYIITRGGARPNVVPDFAEAYYYARVAEHAHPRRRVGTHRQRRQRRCARHRDEDGAGGDGRGVQRAAERVPERRDEQNLERVGGFSYTPEEAKFAEEIRKTLTDPPDVAVGSQEAVGRCVPAPSTARPPTWRT
jgi:aminobenzoyl-glutamate utilization protein B